MGKVRPAIAIARARGAAGAFRTKKLKQLALVSLDRRSKADALRTLQRAYTSLLDEYLRAEGTSYAHWCEHGPKPQLDELVTAAADPSVWDRLVESGAREVGR